MDKPTYKIKDIVTVPVNKFVQELPDGSMRTVPVITRLQTICKNFLVFVLKGFAVTCTSILITIGLLVSEEPKGAKRQKSFFYRKYGILNQYYVPNTNSVTVVIYFYEFSFTRKLFLIDKYIILKNTIKRLIFLNKTIERLKNKFVCIK